MAALGIPMSTLPELILRSCGVTRFRKHIHSADYLLHSRYFNMKLPVSDFDEILLYRL